jgi:hypothetical protein
MSDPKRISELEAENRKLRSQVATLGGELDYIGSRFVASSQRQTFHRPECQWAFYIMSSQYLIEFDSHREAVQAGYKPCKTCRA